MIEKRNLEDADVQPLFSCEPKKTKTSGGSQTYRQKYSLLWPCLTASKISSLQHVLCTVCNRDFSIVHGGRNDCKRHVDCKMHKDHLSLKKITLPLASFFERKDEKMEEHRKITRAEATMCEFIVDHNQPFAAADSLTKAFKVMFPDSKIAQSLQKWLENVPCAERALHMLDNLKAFCSAVEQKRISAPTCKSFKVIKLALQDPLLKAKLEFFLSVADDAKCFLTSYQTDRPMVPFLAKDLSQLTKDLMKRFLKEEVLQDLSVLGVTTIDFANKDNQVDLSKINVGFSARWSLRSVKDGISDKMRLAFRVDCRNFLIAMLQNILDKSPLSFPLTRRLTWLDPQKLVTLDGQRKAKKKLSGTLELLVHAKREDAMKCEVTLKQFDLLCQSVFTSIDHPFHKFDPEVDRLDELWKGLLFSQKQFSDLWSVVQMLLLLSHGQATVERGFSVNRQTTVENISGESLKARRHIIQAVRDSGGPTKVAITKEMLCYASSARMKYQNYLEEKKKAEEAEKRGEKRKAEESELTVLKTKVQRLESDVKALRQSSVSKAEEAESKGRLSLISESNALRKRAEEKETEIGKLRVLIQEKEAH